MTLTPITGGTQHQNSLRLLLLATTTLVCTRGGQLEHQQLFSTTYKFEKMEILLRFSRTRLRHHRVYHRAAQNLFISTAQLITLILLPLTVTLLHATFSMVAQAVKERGSLPH
jgi:hypothetical protein